MDLENNVEYPYRRVPLTPAIIEELIVKLFTGDTVHRKTIVDEVDKYHLANGGLRANAVDANASVKKALASAKEKGIAVNTSFGYWKIGDAISSSAFETEQLKKEENIVVLAPPIADKVIGIGSSYVYLYYWSIYRQRAETENENAWFCKVGKTDRDPLARILNQAATALPEKPHIALLIKTDFPAELETAIHCILTVRGKKVHDAPGSEWFLTTPDEVEEIVSNIFNRA